MIFVLGSDGYLGRPTARELKKYDVICVDNYIKRKLLKEYGIATLFGTDTKIDHIFDIQSDLFCDLVQKYRPEAIIDYAEIPSAPYSMMGNREAALTIDNNLFGTLRMIQAVRDYSPKTHIIKLGTMGEYGTPNIDIEEGWIDILHNGRKDRLLYPKTPGSLYHVTKVFDSDLLAFACRTWGLRVTDLNQGFVYGIDEDSRFCYDDIFGTALNRFIVQAVIGHPLTVYGRGGQTRGIINIIDTIKCVELALNNPAKEGEFRVFNQFTEQASVRELAYKVVDAADSLGMKVTVGHIENPRLEKEEHYYNAKHTALPSLGLKPVLLNPDILIDMLNRVEKQKDYINKTQIVPNVKWA